jgi:ketosteroid isomerase-like protein
MRFGLLCAASLALTACAPDPAKVDAEIRQLVSAYLTTTDVAASVDMLDPAVTVTSISGEGRITRGRDAIKEHANQNIALLRQLQTTVGAIEITRVGAAHAVVIAPFSIALNAVPQLTMADGAATLLLARRDSGWKVVHEHYSYSALRRP